MRSKTSFKRARQPAQIEQRRREILNAAAFLMQRNGFDNVSLNAIARRTCLAKSNIYRYFESKEEIYLQLLKDDWTEWLDVVENDLQPHSGSNDIEAVSKAIAQSLCASPRMCELISVLASVLENNLSEEALVGFKTDTLTFMTRLPIALITALPDMPSDKALQAAQSIFALIAGLWPLANPGAMLEKVMLRPEFAPMKLEFCSAIGAVMTLVFKGACVK